MSQFYHPDNGTQPTPVVTPPPSIPPKQPPRKRMSTESKIGLTIAVVLALAVLLIGIAAAVVANSTPPVQQDTSVSLTASAQANATAVATGIAGLNNDLTQTAMTPTPILTTPVASSPNGDVGITQQSGVWSVIVNSIATSNGDEAFTPKSGNTYLVIGVTLLNTSATTQVANEMVLFDLRDTQGYQYTPTALLNDQVIFGSVVAGQQLRGHLVYEVPKSVTSFVLQCQDNFDPSTVVQWNLSV